MNKKAQLFTLDLLLALVPLTLVLGYSASAMSGAMTQIQEYSYFYSNQRMVNDAVDVLIKTPGEPINWDATNPPTITGLAGYDSATNKTFPNQLDLVKISALEASFLENVLGNFSYYNLTLENVSGQISFYRNWSSGSRNDASSIFVAERIVTIPLNIVANATTDNGTTFTTEIQSSDDVYGTQVDAGNNNDSMTFNFPNLGIATGSSIDSVKVIVEHHEDDVTGFQFPGEDGVDNGETRPRDDVKVWNGSAWEYIEDYGVRSSDKNYISRDFSNIINTPALANGIQVRMYYDPEGSTGATFYADYAIIQIQYTYLGRTYDVPAPSFARLRLEAGR